MNRIKKYGYPFLVLLLITVSFLYFAPVFHNRYTSDSAIHVLMAYYLKLPNDLYYWGQERLGSIVPMMAAIPVKLFGLSPIWCVSIVQYLFLGFSFFFFSSLLQQKLLRILLCVVWFFPLGIFDYHLQIGQPYAGQLFFLGWSVYLIAKINLQEIEMRRTHIRLFLSALFFMLSVWVSDLNTFIIPVYLGLMCGLFIISRNIGEKKYFAFNKSAFKKSFPFLFSGAVIGYVFIRIAKINSVTNVPEYDILFSPVSEIQKGFSLVFDYWYKAHMFRVKNILISGSCIATSAVFVLLLVYYFRKKTVYGESALKLFFFFSALFTFLIVIASNWVQVNGYDVRYFTFSYFMLMMFLFVATDSIRIKQYKMIATVFLSIASFAGAINLMIGTAIKFDSPRYLTAKEIDTFSKKLGKCALMGDYWTSYNLSSIHPEYIKATTWDYLATRDKRIIEPIMKEKTIYLVANTWLDSFPEIKNEFGYFLRRSGKPFELQGLRLCKYENVIDFQMPLTMMRTRNALLSRRSADVEGPLLVKKDSIFYVKDFLVFGPFVKLLRGTYLLDVELGTIGKGVQGDTVSIDLVSAYGAKIHAKREYVLDGVNRLRMNVRVKFKLNKLTPDMEIRMFLKGRSQVYMKNMRLRKLYLLKI